MTKSNSMKCQLCINFSISHKFLASIIYQQCVNIEVILQLHATIYYFSVLQSKSNHLTIKIHSSSSSMTISSFSSSYPLGTLLNNTFHSSIDILTSHSPLPINVKPNLIFTTTQTHHYHSYKALENLVGLCHAPKPTLRTWWSFHTSSPKAQSGNDTNIYLITGNYQLLNSYSE